MKIKKYSKINRSLAAFCIIIVGAGLFLAYFYVSNSKNSKISDPVNVVQPNSDKDQAAHLKNNPKDKNISPNSDKPIEPTSSNSPSKKQVQVVASSDMSSGIIYLRGRINYPVASGSCFAQLKGPSSQNVRKDTTLLQNPASTDCKTIQIPISELTSGKWTFDIHYESDIYEGTSDEVSFSV